MSDLGNILPEHAERQPSAAERLAAEKEAEMRRAADAAVEAEMRRSGDRRDASPTAEKSPADTPVQAAEPAAPSAPAAAPAPEKDSYRVRVERALEQGLRDTYFAMPKGRRDKFRARGEAAASKLRALLGGTPRPSQIEDEIHGWLKTIPKEDPLYLLQGTKIKTDAILEMNAELRRDRGEA